jgi:hypothetical protein
MTKIFSVYIFLSINTDRVSDEKTSVGKDHQKIPMEKIRR